MGKLLERGLALDLKKELGQLQHDPFAAKLTPEKLVSTYTKEEIKIKNNNEILHQ
jgi:hypothetical protein